MQRSSIAPLALAAVAALAMMIGASRGTAVLNTAGSTTESASTNVRGRDLEPEMYLVVADHVRPGMIPRYENASRRMIEAFREVDADPAEIGWLACSGTELGHLWFMPVDGFAGTDALLGRYADVIERIDADRWRSIQAELDVCIEWKERYHAVALPELSHRPSVPPSQVEPWTFMGLRYLYVRPDRETAFRAVMAEMVSMHEASGVDVGFTCYEVVTGGDLPLFIVQRFAPSAAAYHRTEASITELLGADGADLAGRLTATLRRVEERPGRVRPDLAFVPQEAGTSN